MYDTLLCSDSGKPLPRIVTAVCKLPPLKNSTCYQYTIAVDAIKLFATLDMLLLSICFIYTGENCTTFIYILS